MALISIPYIFSAGNTIIASQHNSNNTTIYNLVNGSIDNTNISSTAAIKGSQLDLSSPGAIGATTPSTGKFTTLTTTGATSLGSTLGVTGAVTLSSTLNLGSTNQGDILYDNGTSIVRLTPGTSGYFLKTQGASANPVWTSVPTPFSSQNVVTGSRAFGGVYQNTSGKTMFVTFSIAFSGGGTIKVLSDASSSPSTQVAGICTTNIPSSFMVLNNNYYEVALNSGSVNSASTNIWTEWY